MKFLLSWLMAIFFLSGTNAQMSIVKFQSAYQHSLGNTDLFSDSRDAFVLNSSIVPFQKRNIVSANSSIMFIGFDIVGYSLNAGLPFSGKYGTAFLLSGYGNMHYKQNSVSFSFSRLIGSKISLGIRQNIANTRIENTSSNFTSTTSLSFTAKGYKWGMSAIISGLFPVHTKERLHKTMKFTLGTFHNISDNATITGSIWYSVDNTIQSSLALSITFVNEFDLHIGILLRPVIYSFGIDFPIAPYLSAIISDQYHLILGHSPAVGIVYKW